jgi:hypothetical protein
LIHCTYTILYTFKEHFHSGHLPLLFASHWASVAAAADQDRLRKLPHCSKAALYSCELQHNSFVHVQ